MRSLMMVLPRQSREIGPGDNLITWTDEDHLVLEFRFRRHYAPDDERFADFVAYGLVQDDLDAEIISRAVVSCNSLRMYDRMRTDWLIEDCELRHTLKIRP
jgi:hypothetical protein